MLANCAKKFSPFLAAAGVLGLALLVPSKSSAQGYFGFSFGGPVGYGGYGYPATCAYYDPYCYGGGFAAPYVGYGAGWGYPYAGYWGGVPSRYWYGYGRPYRYYGGYRNYGYRGYYGGGYRGGYGFRGGYGNRGFATRPYYGGGYRGSGSGGYRGGGFRGRR